MLNTYNARRMLDSIENKYNPENDTAPGIPLVTWTDNELAKVNDRLLQYIIELEQRIARLEQNQPTPA
jgi:hypothetical protein